jgi:hypothetical protein
MYSAGSAPVVQTLSNIHELVENLLLLLSEKEKFVIRNRFNLDKSGKRTLESIGKEFSVTRERVRQIEKSALQKMRRNVFNTALSDLHQFISDEVKAQGGLFKKDSLVDELLSLVSEETDTCESCIDLSLELHENLDTVGNTIEFHPYVREKDLPDFAIKHAAKKLVNQLHKYGDTKKLQRVHSDLEDFFKEINFDVKRVKSLITIDKRLTLLGDDLVGLMEWRHIRPRTLRDKILYVLRNDKKPMHFSDITEKICKANFDNRNVNMQAVHNELIRHEGFVLIGRGIYALSEWGYERGTVAEVIERILATEGEMAQEDIVAKVFEQRQVKKITIVLALKNNTKFERVGRHHYCLKA